MMTRTLAVFSLVLGLFFGMATAHAATPGPAAQPVERLQSALIASMKAGHKLDYSARYKKLDPIVAKAFDFKFIARIVLGADWNKLDAAQQKQFVATLDKLSTSSYAKEFKSYSGEHFEFVSGRELPGGALERYVFHTGDKTVHFDYQMRQSDGQWMIANVIVDGVSDLALKRGQYRRLYSARGFKGLLTWLDKQIAANGKK